MGQTAKEDIWAGANVIIAYTRRQAIADGVLVDLSCNYPSDTRMFQWNLCCTAAVWLMIERAAETDGVDIGTYVWDVCWMASLAIKAVRDSGSEQMFFKVCLPLRSDGTTEKKLKMVCAPDDDGKPCLTIMMPEED